MKTCRNCLWFHQYYSEKYQTDGECRFNPPQNMIQLDNKGKWSGFPQVSFYSTCKEHTSDED